MTRFYREGHYRTKAYGNQYWVSGHEVERFDWDRLSRVRRIDPDFQLLHDTGAYGRPIARFLTPNARCPVCGAQILYYQNKHGSRVFFDDVWPHWPKHLCTDPSLNEGYGDRAPRVTTSDRPPARNPDEQQAILDAARRLGVET